MSFSRRAARARARAAGPLPTQGRSQADRMHLYESNLQELANADQLLPRDRVIVVCDPRDPVAKNWARLGKDEASLDQHQLGCVVGRLIPTIIMDVPRDLAIDLTAISNPTISETIERIPADAHRVVLVISGGGMLFQAIPREPAKTVIILQSGDRLDQGRHSS